MDLSQQPAKSVDVLGVLLGASSCAGVDVDVDEDGEKAREVRGAWGPR